MNTYLSFCFSLIFHCFWGILYRVWERPRVVLVIAAVVSLTKPASLCSPFPWQRMKITQKGVHNNLLAVNVILIDWDRRQLSYRSCCWDDRDFWERLWEIIGARCCSFFFKLRFCVYIYVDSMLQCVCYFCVAVSMLWFPAILALVRFQWITGTLFKQRAQIEIDRKQRDT